MSSQPDYPVIVETPVGSAVTDMDKSAGLDVNATGTAGPAGFTLDVPDLEERISSGLHQVEDLLQQSVHGSRGLVDDLTAHLAQAGGKRIRPLLTLVCAQFGSDSTPSQCANVINAAAVMELTHIASLYHDDVMDSAPTRRGVPSAQRVWGNNRAILAGDVLFSRASSLVTQLGIESVDYHARTFERLCVGQLNESFGPPEGDNRIDFYLQVLSDKTGSLLAAAAYFGALHGGAGTGVASIVADFGEKVGVAFQIADDVLDLVSSTETLGKVPGTDLREGVDTLPTLLLRQHAAQGTIDPEGESILVALSGDLSTDDALADVVHMLRNHPVIDETRKLATDTADEAIAGIAALPDGEPKHALEEFARLMVNRIV